MNDADEPRDPGEHERGGPRTTVADLLERTHRQPLPWHQAAELALALARVLDAHDLPLHPEMLDVSPAPTEDRPTRVDLAIRSDTKPRSFGATGTGAEASERWDPRWLPPAQADGAPWDAAANRYFLGLLLYRLLSGQHAFAGGARGLRLAMQEARRGAAPMPPDVAATLPPGLQGYCLRLLDPEIERRPGAEDEIIARLRSFLRPATREPSVATRRPELIREPTRVIPELTERPGRPIQVPRAWIGGALSVVLGSAIAIAYIGRTPPAPVAPEASKAPLPRVAVPLTQPITADRARAVDCAECHPRQASEWQRSVMGQSGQSPLFQALEILIEEQVGRSDTCAHGAGVLRKADPGLGCRDDNTGLLITGSGGEHWCVNCHTPLENLAGRMPAWDGRSLTSRSRQPVRDLLAPREMAGIDCAFCHQVHGPVQIGDSARGRYEGNPFWTSTQTGQRFSMRPEDARGISGIANSGYSLDPATLLASAADAAPGVVDAQHVSGGVHRRPSAASRDYLRSSQFCGACHDVRIFGSDALGVARGENFKRLRNAYSEWVSWAADEARAGRQAASCQDCHMSLYPGVCVPAAPGEATVGAGNTALERACPPGTRFAAREPGVYADAPVATGSSARTAVTSHYFSGVDVPLAKAFADALIHEPQVDIAGTPLGAHQRRDLLLGASFRFQLDGPTRSARQLEIPVVLENVGAGHRIPAGFSQEREFWVHLRVTDARGDLVYEVGRVDRGDEDLRDKLFLRVNTDDFVRDGQGRPLGVFGADVADGPDVPRWRPPVDRGGTSFRGRGLINLQNGFLRCVRCVGFIDALGECQPLPGQEATRAARFEDGAFDVDTGVCESNLFGEAALLETYFPIGSLDATRGLVRGPDAIIDRRSAPPDVPLRYTYELDTGGREGPFSIEARLMFRAFPPFLLRAFMDYERRQAARGLRPSGPLITEDALARLDLVELHRVRAEVP